MSEKKSLTFWFVSQYAGAPTIGMQYRQYQFAKELVRMGHNAVIISSTYSHLFRNYPTSSKKFNFEKREGIDYCWIKTPKYEKSISIGRFWNMLVFAWRLIFLPSKRLNVPDAIVVSSPSVFPIQAAIRWRKKFQCKLFFEVRDIWPLTLMELGGLSKWHPAVLFMRYFEKKAYRKSNKVISLLPCAENHFLSSGMPEGNFVHIPNGIDSELQIARAESIQKTETEKSITIGYGGSIGTANAIGYLLDAAELLKHRTDIKFVLLGKGDDLQNVQKRIEHLNQVELLPPVEKSEFLNKLLSFDVCYIGLRPDSLFRFGVSPNKLFDYMQAGKPILYNIDSGNKPVDEARCGISVSPGKTNELVDAIEKFAAMSPEERNELGMNGKNYVLQHHSYSKLATHLISCLED